MLVVVKSKEIYSLGNSATLDKAIEKWLAMIYGGRTKLCRKPSPEIHVWWSPVASKQRCLVAVGVPNHDGISNKAIIKHDFPYDFVEYDKIKEWVTYIIPDVVMTSRNNIDLR
ncbi:zinc finger BED domain-containing protein RICESLEEPER 2-like [Senna tora]|uniref:Zinc finger BED domain-containing protein RICESLEEPER 2-like n=1 Tax=Senna tora TaxID=362788 RepID=A0A834TQD8_9FABA|nr:zinc finger BED domain-containing protein RICESLEEPER 2-like [Senna tora]